MSNLLIKSLYQLNPVKVYLTQVHRCLNRASQQGHKSTDIPQPPDQPETVYETPHPGRDGQPHDEPTPLYKATPRVDLDPLEDPIGHDDIIAQPHPMGTDQVGPVWGNKGRARAKDIADADEPPVGHGNYPNATPITSKLQQADVPAGAQVTSTRSLN